MTCAVQCRGAVQSSSNRLVRLLGVDSEPVNQGWLCDKGRYGYEWVHADDRVRVPMVREQGDLVEVSWPEALDAAAAGLRKVLDVHGPEGVAVLGGGRGTNEDAYVWARFAKGVLGTDNVDAQLGDGLPAEVVLGLPRATIADCDRAAAIVLLAPDLKEELPVLFLRVRRGGRGPRRAARRRRAVRQRPHGDADAVVRYVPGEVPRSSPSSSGRSTATAPATTRSTGRLPRSTGRDGDVVVILGRPSLAESPDSVGARRRRARSAAPARGSSRRSAGERARRARPRARARASCPAASRSTPGASASPTRGARFPSAAGSTPPASSQAAVDGQLHGSCCSAPIPSPTSPTAASPRDAIADVDFVIACDAFLADEHPGGERVPPRHGVGREARHGHQPRGPRPARSRSRSRPRAPSMDDWRIAAELAARFGADFDLETVDEVQDEIARVAPAFAGVDAALLRRARDGVVLPLGDHHDEIVLDAAGPPLTDASWEPILPGRSPPRRRSRRTSAPAWSRRPAPGRRRP